jgi:cytochrome c-type biogenesis protein CcmH/NrfF
MFPVPFSELVMYASMIMGQFINYFIEVCVLMWADPLMLLALGICIVVGMVRLIQGLLWA